MLNETDFGYNRKAFQFIRPDIKWFVVNKMKYKFIITYNIDST